MSPGEPVFASFFQENRMLTYDALVKNLDHQINVILPRQVMDKNRNDYGGFVTDGIAGSSGVSTVSSLGYAYLIPESQYYLQEEILERILLAAEFGRRTRRESGCFDLIISNFDSAPDTAFLVKAMGPVVRAARKAAEERQWCARRRRIAGRDHSYCRARTGRRRISYTESPMGHGGRVVTGIGSFS